MESDGLAQASAGPLPSLAIRRIGQVKIGEILIQVGEAAVLQRLIDCGRFAKRLVDDGEIVLLDHVHFGRIRILKAHFPQDRKYDWTGRLSNVRGIGPGSVIYRAIGRLGSSSTGHYGVLRACRPRGIVGSGI